MDKIPNSDNTYSWIWGSGTINDATSFNWYYNTGCHPLWKNYWTIKNDASAWVDGWGLSANIILDSKGKWVWKSPMIFNELAKKWESAQNSGMGELPPGVIAGIVIGSIIVAACIIAMIVYCVISKPTIPNKVSPTINKQVNYNRI